MTNHGYAAVVSSDEIVLVIEGKPVYIDRPNTYEALFDALTREAPLDEIKRIAELD